MTRNKEVAAILNEIAAIGDGLDLGAAIVLSIRLSRQRFRRTLRQTVETGAARRGHGCLPEL